MSKDMYIIIEKLVEEYIQAKKAGNKKEVKLIKGKLSGMNVSITETSQGVKWTTTNQLGATLPKISKLRKMLITLFVGKTPVMMNMEMKGSKLFVTKPGIIKNNSL